jgi:hypothetical protein
VEESYVALPVTTEVHVLDLRVPQVLKKKEGLRSVAYLRIKPILGASWVLAKNYMGVSLCR